MSEAEFGFEDFDSKPNLDVPIPQKCQGCAIQCELRSHVANLILAKHLATELGGNLIGELGERFDEVIDEHLSDEMVEETKKEAREAVGRGIDYIDQEIKATTQEINANSLSCSGVLKMRAPKDDVSYTVNVCTSARVNIRDGEPQRLPVLIRAESINKPS